MAKIFIEDLRKLRGEVFTTNLAVKQFNEAPSRTGRNYLKLLVSDKSGDIDARCFDQYDHFLTFLECGKVFQFVVQADNFNNRDYLKVKKILPVDSYELSDFIPVSPHDPEAMKQELCLLLDSLKDESCVKLLDTFRSDKEWMDKFCKWPAAKEWHHSYLYGLLEHTLAVMKLSDSISSQYQNINRDMLLTGAFLHDIGKMDEYEIDGAVIDIGTRGRLLGHIITGCSLVEERCEQVSVLPKMRDSLLHMITSHHGQYEWGSPKLPAFREAFVLHVADLMDSQLNGLDKLAQTYKGREWTDYNRFLERHIYINQED